MQQELAEKGIQPFQVQSVDKDEIGVKLIWSALTIAYKDYPTRWCRACPAPDPGQPRDPGDRPRAPADARPRPQAGGPRAEATGRSADGRHVHAAGHATARAPGAVWPGHRAARPGALRRRAHRADRRQRHSRRRRRAARARAARPERAAGVGDQPRPEQRPARGHGRAGARVLLPAGPAGPVVDLGQRHRARPRSNARPPRPGHRARSLPGPQQHHARVAPRGEPGRPAHASARAGRHAGADPHHPGPGEPGPAHHQPHRVAALPVGHAGGARRAHGGRARPRGHHPARVERALLDGRFRLRPADADPARAGRTTSCCRRSR